MVLWRRCHRRERCTCSMTCPCEPGGCAANVAIDLAKQGIAVDVAGCVGQDSAADVLLKTLRQMTLAARESCALEGWPTSKTVILLIEGQDRRYLHVTGANTSFHRRPHSSRLARHARSVLSRRSVRVCRASMSTSWRHCSHSVATAKVVTVVDVIGPAGRARYGATEAALPLIDVFVPNEDEARAFTGFTDPFDQLRAFQKARREHRHHHSRQARCT